LLEPARELAFRLMLEPEPGELDQGADALLAPLRAAVEGRASEADEAADLTAIIEVAVIDLVGKHLGDGLADALEPHELRCSCRRGAGAGGTQVGLDRGLDGGNLLDEQQEAGVLARDLAEEERRQAAAIAGAPLLELR